MTLRGRIRPVASRRRAVGWFARSHSRVQRGIARKDLLSAHNLLQELGYSAGETTPYFSPDFNALIERMVGTELRDVERLKREQGRT